MENSRFWMRVKDFFNEDTRSLYIQDIAYPGHMKTLIDREHEWFMGAEDDHYFKRLKVKQSL